MWSQSERTVTEETKPMKEKIAIRVMSEAIMVKIPIDELEPRPLELTVDERKMLRVFASKIKKAPSHVWVYVG